MRLFFPVPTVYDGLVPKNPCSLAARRPERNCPVLMKRTLALLLSALLLTTAALAATEPEHTPPAEPEVLQEPVAADETWKTLLVNPQNPLPEEFSVELATLKNGLTVDKRIYDDLNAMLTDCRKTGLQPIVCSAYRPLATQTRLYNNKVARLRAAGYNSESAKVEAARWVAVPGTSEHHTGLALDIVSIHYQHLNEQQACTAEQQWLMEHCWEYGFILRYPADKCAVTGIGYEPWHYRYVGRETAAAIRESGLCLEEYLALPAEAADTSKITEMTSPPPIHGSAHDETA